MPSFRTADELLRVRQVQKLDSVANGSLYTSGDESPFPIHNYFQNKLLGKQVKMVEINAGAALVENMVADAMTDMKIAIGSEDEKTNALEQEAREWLESIDYFDKLEEAAKSYFGVGYAVQQPIRFIDDNENGFTISNVDPATWYPDFPTFTYQPVTSGRIISIFDEDIDGSKKWYALVEKHEIGTVSYELLVLENESALEGKHADLDTLAKFADLEETTDTNLDRLAVFQINHQRRSSEIFGRSVLKPIWDILQEVSETQTQIRQERIKHLRSKMYAPIRSLQKAENVNAENTSTMNSKQLAREEGKFFNMNQDVFPIPDGSSVVPGYIQKDLQAIVIGSQEIDKLLSRAAAIVGAPKSVFNIEESAGNLHVETEKRKDRKYTRRILQGQRKFAALTKDALETWATWSGKKIKNITVSFAPPFDLSREEVIDQMRKMNSDAKFVSQKEAVKEIWKDKKPEDRDELLAEIEDEQKLSEPLPNSALSRINPIEL